TQRPHHAHPGNPRPDAACHVRRYCRPTSRRHRVMPDAKTVARPLLLAAMLGTAALSLSSCAPLVGGGAAATTARVITDRRTSGAQLEDQNIAFKAEYQISQKLGDAARISAVSYNGLVLLTGDAPSEAAKAQATEIARGIQHVKSVVNQM